MKRFRLYIFVFMLYAAFACSKDVVQDPIFETSSSMSAPENMQIDCGGGSFSMAFSADESWTVTGCPDWLKMSHQSGKRGTTVISFSAKYNDERYDRIADIKFEAKNRSFSVPMQITQPRPILEVNSESFDFKWNECRTERDGVLIENEPKILQIVSNVIWKLEECPTTKANVIDMTHFSVSSVSGENDGEIEVIPINDNYYKSPHDIEVRLSAYYIDEKGVEREFPESAVDSYIIKFHQENLRFLIDESADDADVTIDELNNPHEISIDSEVLWRIAEYPDWIRFNKTEGRDIVSVEICADGPNPVCEQRSGKVKLVAECGAYREISVTQKPYVFSVETDHDEFEIENDDISWHTFTLNTTGTWKIKNIPDWLDVSPSECLQTTPESGVENHVISVKAKSQNLEFEDYMQTLEICSSMNDLSDQLPVRQEKFVFNVEHDKSLEDLPTMNTIEYKANIVSSGKWKIIDKPSWIDVSMSESASKGNFDITIRANCGNPDISKDRSAILKVVSVNHEEAGQTVSRTVNVKQRKYTFEVSPVSEVDLAAYKKNFGKFSTTVKCSSEWELEECPDWIKPSETRGDGTVDITIDFIPTENLSRNNRHGEIVIKSLYNSERKSFAVNQEGFVFDDEAKEFDVPVMNGNKPFTVDFALTAEADWELADCPDWIAPSSVSGVGNGSITFRPDNNPELSERKAVVKILSKASHEAKEITFTQEKYEFNSDEETFSYTELSESSDNVNILCSGPWRIDGIPSWLTVTPKSGNTSAAITIKPAHNTDIKDRSVTVNVVSTLNGLKKLLVVSQNAYKFNSESVVYNYATLEERKDAFNVLSSGRWEAKNVPDWIKFSKTNGAGSEEGIEEEVTITSTKNLSESDKDATIQVVSKDNASLVKNISLHQDKFIFSANKSSHNFASPIGDENEPLSVDVKCTANWTAESKDDWIILSQKSFDGNGVLGISVSDYFLDNGGRAGKVTLRSALNGLVREIAITQNKYILEVSSNTVEIASCPASVHTIDVTCSGSWKVSSDNDWLKVSQNTSKGDGKIEITALDNPEEHERKAVITVASTNSSDLVREINVTQKGHKLEVDAASLTFAANPKQSQTFKVVADGLWNVSSDAAWCHVSMNESTGIVTVRADANGSILSERTASITVSCSNTTLGKTVTVKQDKFVFGIDKKSHSFESPIGNENESFNVNVTCSADWTAESNVDWITLSPNSYDGNGELRIGVKNNYTKTSRAGIVTVRSTLNGLEETINITQNPYVFDVMSDGTIEIDACPASAHSIDIVCSGNWQTSSNGIWLTVSPGKSKGNGRVNITAGNNPDEVARTATVTIASADNPDFVKTINVTQKGHKFNVGATSLAFASNPAQSQTFMVDADGPWTVSSSSSWCHVSKDSGTGTVTVRADINESTSSERTATITVSCSNSGLKKTVAVRQEKFVFIVEPALLAFAANPSQSQTFRVTADASWTVSSDASWCHVSKDSGTGAVTVRADVNESTSSERTATITVSCSNTTLKKTVSVRQDKFIFSIDKHSHTFESPIGNSSFDVSIECTAGWTARSNATWLTLSPASSEGNGVLRIGAADNYSQTSRTGTVTVRSTLNGLEETITVIQNPYVFDVVSSGTVEIDACPASAHTIDVICSGSWKVSSNSAWLTVSQSTSKGNGRVDITADSNPDERNRAAVVTVASTDNPDLMKTINVTQKGHLFTVDATSLTFDSAPSQSQTFKVTADGSWTVSSNASWCHVSKDSGTGTVTVRADVNESTLSERTAVITVSCSNTTLKKTVAVRQEKKFVLNIDKHSYVFESPIGNVPLNVNVECNGGWTAGSNAAWLTLSPTSSEGNGVLRIEVADNYSQTSRTGVITVRSIDKGLVETITVTQNPYVFDVASDDAVTIDAFSGRMSPIAVSCSGNWQADTDCTWLTLSQDTFNGNGHLVIMASDNPETDERTADVVIVVYASDGNTAVLKKTIKITQKMHVLNVGAALIGFVSNPEDSQIFTVTADGPWEVNCDADWCHVSGNADTGIVAVTADANDSTEEERSASIIVSLTNTKISKVVTVIQGKASAEETI